MRLNDDLWFSDPQNGQIEIKNGSNSGWGTLTGNFNPASSREYKKDIETLSKYVAFELLENLRPVRFKYKEEKDQENLGFIAEEIPELIAVKNKKSVRTIDIVAVLTKVVKEQQKMIEKQGRDMQEQLNAMRELQAEVKQLKSKDYMAKN